MKFLIAFAVLFAALAFNAEAQFFCRFIDRCTRKMDRLSDALQTDYCTKFAEEANVTIQDYIEESFTDLSQSGNQSVNISNIISGLNSTMRIGSRCSSFIIDSDSSDSVDQSEYESFSKSSLCFASCFNSTLDPNSCNDTTPLEAPTLEEVSSRLIQRCTRKINRLSTALQTDFCSKLADNSTDTVQSYIADTFVGLSLNGTEDISVSDIISGLNSTLRIGRRCSYLIIDKDLDDIVDQSEYESFSQSSLCSASCIGDSTASNCNGTTPLEAPTVMSCDTEELM